MLFILFMLMEKINLIYFVVVLFWNPIMSLIISRCFILLTSLAAKFSLFLLIFVIFTPFMIVHILIFIYVFIGLIVLFLRWKTIKIEIIIIEINVKIIELYCTNSHHLVTMKRSFFVHFISSLFRRTVHVLKIPHIKVHQSVKENYCCSIVSISSKCIVSKNKNYHCQHEKYGVSHK